MTSTPSYKVERIPFDSESIKNWEKVDGKHVNWPVVYTLNGSQSVYVGESTSAANRLKQHLVGKKGLGLRHVNVVLDEKANKSACLDLESFLIRLFSGDGQFEVMNRNDGLVEADYFNRHDYRETFNQVFEDLRAQGLFTRPLPEIQNSALFKLSPFKALNSSQAVCIENVVEDFLTSLDQKLEHTVSIIQGEPGTGKTVVGIFLLKLLRDIANAQPLEDAEVDPDSMFSEFFTSENTEKLSNLKIGLVVPQQSLRKTVSQVFRMTPGLLASDALSTWSVADSDEVFDLLIVDEAHRLNVRSAQATPALTGRFPKVNEKLFGRDDVKFTQLDWLKNRARHLVLLIDPGQAIRPADLPRNLLETEINEAKRQHRYFNLLTQMRLQVNEEYVESIRSILQSGNPKPLQFEEYELELFEDFSEMRDVILAKESEVGLSRLVAGYAWEWVSKNDSEAFDMELDGVKLKWNTQATDWVASPTSIYEMGSIHTIQGYDLNYAGVVIGPDLKFDEQTQKVFFDKNSHFDTPGKRQNNNLIGVSYSDEEIQNLIINIYTVLLTRGIRGTFVYAVDLPLRKYLARFLPLHS